MPNYEYGCDSCGILEEHYRKVEERDDFPVCSSCKTNLRRIINPTPVKFNGSGFYSTGG